MTFYAAALWQCAMPTLPPRWRRSGWRARPSFPAAISPPGRGGGWRWRGFWCRSRPLWLLDEPFAALDAAGQALVAQLMARHCGEGGIVIAATHEPLGLGNESLKL